MKYIKLVFFCLLLFNCTSNKTVYWCGDHPCINNKEKKAFFEKNMIVEKRELNKEDKLSKSEKDIIVKKIREEEKNKYKNRKERKKQARINKKKKNNQKNEDESIISSNVTDCSNPKGFHQKMMCAATKKKTKDDLIKKISKKKLDTDTSLVKIEDSFNELNDYVEKITKKNKFRPYPDINDIPK